MAPLTPTRRRLHAAVAVALSIGAVALALPGPAQAKTRDVILQFLPPPAPVDGYRFYLFDEMGGVEEVVDTGLISPDGDGIGRVVFGLENRQYKLSNRDVR